MTDTPALDLDAKRDERAKARAARHEGRGDTLPVVFGGQAIVTLDAEFPMSVLEPLTALNVDIAYLIRGAVQMMAASEAEQRTATVGLLVDVLAASPGLPGEIITAVKEMGRRLLGDDGYAAFTAQSPTWWDVRDLIQGLMDWYGVRLGESPPSPPSLNGSETSKQTSSGTTTLTPAASGKSRARKGSSGSGGSSG
jgi:hypothetical protein